MADDFLTTYAPLANDIATATKLDPSVVLGIIDTETGHGQHVLGNNIFGISPGGRVAQYPDVQTGSQAFVSLMQTPRYASVAAAPDPASQAAALVKSGYNTVNPKYAATVAANAQNAAKVLGYEDNAPATEKDKALADPALQTTQQPEATTTPSASTDKAPSEKDKALADPALQVSKPPSPAEPPAMTFDEYGRPLTDGVPPSMSDVLAAGAKAQAPTKQQIINLLQPDPNMIYGSPDPTAPPGTPMGGNPLGAMFSPFARDPKTGDTHLTLPPLPRAILLGLAGGFGPEGMTYDPKTGTMNLTPEAMAAASLGANPLQFSGPNALVREPPSMLTQMGVTKPLPVTLPELNAAIARAGPEPPPAPPTPAPSGGPGAGASGSPQPTAAGAEATTAPIPEKTPVQAQRDLETSVAQTAADRAGPQMQDHNVYVPGVQRTLAEREFTPQNALDEKVSMADPAFRQQVEAIKKDNNEAMVDLLRKDAGDKITLDDAYTAREAVAPDALALFRDETPVDAAPIVKQIDDILAGPSGKRAAVRNTLGNVRTELFDSDGNLEVMPSQLYGARQNITDLLKKGAKGTSEQAGDVQVSKAHLESLLEPLDETINGGAPRYQQYLNDFRAASQPINQMEYLQQFQPSGARNIAGPGGNPTFNKVNGMLSQIARDRAARGINKAKSLTEDQIQNVIAVRNELAAVDLKDRLAAVKGSDTFQQLQRAGETGSGPVGTAVKGLAGLGAEGLAHALLAPTTGGTGNALLAGGAATYRFAIRPAMRKAAENRQAKAVADAVAARRAALLETQPSPSAAP